MKTFAHLNQNDIEALPRNAVAILPLGATENHGGHLPLGTDSILADAILDRVTTRLEEQKDSTPAVRLPCLWLGASVEHTERRGTLSTWADRIVDQILDISEGLTNSGIHRLILFSAHGGNNPLSKIAAVETRDRFGMLCAAAHWMDFGTPKSLSPPTPVRHDAHGGWMETSMMMLAAPELVGKNLPSAEHKSAPAPMLFPGGPIAWGWASDDLGTDGVIGDATHATYEIGRQIMGHATQSLATLITQMSEADWSPTN